MSGDTATDLTRPVKLAWPANIHPWYLLRWGQGAHIILILLPRSIAVVPVCHWRQRFLTQWWAYFIYPCNLQKFAVRAVCDVLTRLVCALAVAQAAPRRRKTPLSIGPRISAIDLTTYHRPRRDKNEKNQRQQRRMDMPPFYNLWAPNKNRRTTPCYNSVDGIPPLVQTAHFFYKCMYVSQTKKTCMMHCTRQKETFFFLRIPYIRQLHGPPAASKHQVPPPPATSFTLHNYNGHTASTLDYNTRPRMLDAPHFSRAPPHLPLPTENTHPKETGTGYNKYRTPRPFSSTHLSLRSFSPLFHPHTLLPPWLLERQISAVLTRPFSSAHSYHRGLVKRQISSVLTTPSPQQQQHQPKRSKSAF